MKCTLDAWRLQLTLDSLPGNHQVVKLGTSDDFERLSWQPSSLYQSCFRNPGHFDRCVCVCVCPQRGLPSFLMPILNSTWRGCLFIRYVYFSSMQEIQIVKTPWITQKQSYQVGIIWPSLMWNFKQLSQHGLSTLFDWHSPVRNWQFGEVKNVVHHSPFAWNLRGGFRRYFTRGKLSQLWSKCHMYLSVVSFFLFKTLVLINLFAVKWKFFLKHPLHEEYGL